MIPCLFASDLHGSATRAATLLDVIARQRPRAVFLGGDLLAHGDDGDFLSDILVPGLERLRGELGGHPEVFVVLGNDDRRATAEPLMRAAAERGIEWTERTTPRARSAAEAFPHRLR